MQLGTRDIPQEVLEIIIEFASRRGNRRKASLNLSLVCKHWHLPGLRALYRDLHVDDGEHFNGLMAACKRSPGQQPLLGARKLYMVIKNMSNEDLKCGINIHQAKVLLDESIYLRSVQIEAAVTPNYLFFEWKPLRWLTRLHIESAEQVSSLGLFMALTTTFMLQKLHVTRLESTGYEETATLPSMPLRTLTLTDSMVSDSDLLKLGKSCSETLREFTLHQCKTVTRKGIVDVLKVIGPGLNTCEMRACTFADEAANGQAPVGPFMDDIASICPFLLELQVCSDEICTPNILSRALMILPLRHLELNCRLPHFEPGQLIEALRFIPIGRLETLFIGPHLKWNDESLARVRQSCIQQAIMFSSGLDLDQLGDPCVGHLVCYDYLYDDAQSIATR